MMDMEMMELDMETRMMMTQQQQQQQKHYAKDSWPDIFKKSKIILKGNAYDEISTIIIDCADSNFTEMFGYSSLTTGVQVRLNDLIGPATSLAKFDELKRAMDFGKSTCAYVNLYRCDGTALSCHVSLLSITGKNTFTEDNSFQDSSFPDAKLKSSTDSENRIGERYAVLTIRSAAVVGNARDFGIGFFGLSSITEDSKLRHVARLYGVTHMQPAASDPNGQSSFTTIPAIAVSNPYQTRTKCSGRPMKKRPINPNFATPISRKWKSRKTPNPDSGSDDSASGQRVWKKRPTGCATSYGSTARAYSACTIATTTTATSGETSIEGYGNSRGLGLSYDSYEERDTENDEVYQRNFVPLLDHHDYNSTNESPYPPKMTGFTQHHHPVHPTDMSGFVESSPMTFHNSTAMGSDCYDTPANFGTCGEISNTSSCTTTASSSPEVMTQSPRVMKPSFSRPLSMPGPLINADIFQTMAVDYSSSVKRKSPIRPLSPSLMALACDEDFIPNRSRYGYSIL